MDGGSHLDGGTERRLAEAAAHSPEVAGLLARRGRAPRAPWARLALAAAGLAVGVGAIWAVATLASRRPAHETAELDASQYLSPIRTRADPDTGEQTAPFAGFAISVESDPPGALVTIAGVPRGEAPVVVGLDCRSGSRIDIRAEKAGFAPARAATTCRADTLVKLAVRLGR